ncbi:NrfD/PsrC family molybdoenzyme membrane anchor subunit [Natronoarchaeum sp. GCM10025321]|uniref:NrfD/PsrC family molybdoenzyme membrane anchor subunit n=1 Tax=Natronoarchaeum sp. GCM10025321 TaxID=3252684 RepID=UPI00360E6650
MLPLLFLASGFSAGIAAVLMLSQLASDIDSHLVHRFSILDDAIIIVEIVVLAALLYTLSTGGPADTETYASLTEVRSPAVGGRARPRTGGSARYLGRPAGRRVPPRRERVDDQTDLYDEVRAGYRRIVHATICDNLRGDPPASLRRISNYTNDERRPHPPLRHACDVFPASGRSVR